MVLLLSIAKMVGIVVLVVLVAVVLFIMMGRLFVGLVKEIMGEDDENHSGLKCRCMQVHRSTNYEFHPALNLRERLGMDQEITPAADSATFADDAEKPVAVLTFDGTVMAEERTQIAQLVDEVVANKERLGGVFVVVNSPGGAVAPYGQLYAEMLRIKAVKLPLIMCVDTYAASGGYLMVLPADKIFAAPFAMVGSIGVVSEFVNFREFLLNLGIKPITVTAGKFKRTLTPMSEDTPEAREHFEGQLKAIHDQFIALVKQHRPSINTDQVCTGDHWTAQQSVDQKLGLVDGIATSHEVLLEANQNHSLIYLSEKKSRFEKGLLRFFVQLSEQVIVRLISRIKMN
jgi:serine protease SohB